MGIIKVRTAFRTTPKGGALRQSPCCLKSSSLSYPIGGNRGPRARSSEDRNRNLRGLSGSWILNRIFLFILTLFYSFSLPPSIYFANSPLSLLSFSYVSYDSDKRSQEEDRIPNEPDYKYMVTSTRRKSTRSGHPDARQHPDSEAPRTGPLPPP